MPHPPTSRTHPQDALARLARRHGRPVRVHTDIPLRERLLASIVA